jgi:hypothetical protein
VAEELVRARLSAVIKDFVSVYFYKQDLGLGRFTFVEIELRQHKEVPVEQDTPV